MVIIAKTALDNFSRKHPTAAIPLNRWYNTAHQADWSDFSEMKKIFASVDAVGNDHFIFNIKGNDYRLIVMIFFDKRTIYIRFIGTHAEYNKIKDCSII